MLFYLLYYRFLYIIIYILLQGGYLDKNAYDGINEVYSIFLIFAIGIPTLSEVNVLSFTSLIILSLGFFLRCLDCEEEDNKKNKKKKKKKKKQEKEVEEKEQEKSQEE